jgi:hypothetical protein
MPTTVFLKNDVLSCEKAEDCVKIHNEHKHMYACIYVIPACFDQIQ